MDDEQRVAVRRQPEVIDAAEIGQRFDVAARDGHAVNFPGARVANVGAEEEMQAVGAQHGFLDDELTPRERSRAPRADLLRVELREARRLGLEPQRRVVGQPAEVVMRVVDPRRVRKPVQHFKLGRLDTRRDDPAVLVVSRVQLQGDAAAVVGPHGLLHLDGARFRRLQLLLDLFAVGPALDVPLDGALAQVFEWVLVGTGQLVECELHNLAVGEIDEPGRVRRRHVAANARAQLLCLRVATLRDVVGHDATFATLEILWLCHDEQVTRVRRQHHAGLLEALAEVQRQRRARGTAGTALRTEVVERLCAPLVLDHGLVEPALVFAQDVEGLLLVRVVLETQVGKLAHEPRGEIVLDVTRFAAVADGLAAEHELRVAFAGRTARELPHVAVGEPAPRSAL